MPNVMGNIRRRAWLLGVTVALCSPSSTHAADDASAEDVPVIVDPPSVPEVALPLYEQEPFDEILLNEAAGGATFKVRPLDLPGRVIPADPPTRGNLRLQILDRPDESYEVAWRHIERLILFEQRILAEAEQLVAAKDLDRAFQYYSVLYRDYPYTPGLKESAGRFLVESAFAAFQQEEWEHALMYLLEVRRIDPNRAGLAKAMGRVYDKILGQHVAANRYRQARRVLQTAQQDPALRESEPLAAWGTRLAELAGQLQQTSRDAMQAGRYQEAHATGRQMLMAWPDLSETSALVAELQQRFPMVSVGVTQVRGSSDSDPLLHWGGRRVHRLLQRDLMELQAIGPEGGRYECPLGPLELDGQDRGLTILLRSDPQVELGQECTAYEVGAQLLAMANPLSETYRADWRACLSSVSVPDAYRLRVELSRPHLRIESLLRVGLARPLAPQMSRSDNDASCPWVCPYREDQGMGDGVTYRRQADYRLGTRTQPQLVVEYPFADPTRALAALERGEIDMVDRLFPADVARLQNRKDLVVERYAVPTLHMLIPNSDRPYVAHPAFRRAISYGIDRATLLNQEVLGGASLAGCEPISGPLPMGVGDDDPLGYGYDRRIDPHPWSAELSFMLSRITQQALAARAEQRRESPPALETLKLCHPADELPRNVCRVIAAQLSALSIPCVTVELPAGRVRPEGDDWDLWYAEVSLAEPLTDIGHLLGVQGIVSGTSDYVRAAIVNVDQAANWKEARDRLMEVHRLAHDETAVIALWQLVEHFAYRPRLQGVGRNPISLYQHVEKWQWRPPMADMGE